MAILVECITLVIRYTSIVTKFSGGINAFIATVPNSTLCTDRELVGVRFMAPLDVKHYVEFLSSKGLTHKIGTKAIDMVAVDQREGIMTDCDWVDFGQADYEGNPEQTISVCCARPTRETRVAFPKGWNYADSLSKSHAYLEGNQLPGHIQFLRHEDGVDVLLDTNTGIEYFMARSAVK
jgi:hypothetical protein